VAAHQKDADEALRNEQAVIGQDQHLKVMPEELARKWNASLEMAERR